MSDSSSTESAPGATIVNDAAFRAAVSQWTALDDSIRGVTKRMKGVRAKERALRAAILEYMVRSQRDVCYINDRREQICVKKRMRAVKYDEKARRAQLTRALGGDAAKAGQVYNYVFGEPEKEEVPAFARTLSDVGRRRARMRDDVPDDDPRMQKCDEEMQNMDEAIRRNQAFEV